MRRLLLICAAVTIPFVVIALFLFAGDASTVVSEPENGRAVNEIPSTIANDGGQANQPSAVPSQDSPGGSSAGQASPTLLSSGEWAAVKIG
jgi:hypothetical protein